MDNHWIGAHKNGWISTGCHIRKNDVLRKLVYGWKRKNWKMHILVLVSSRLESTPPPPPWHSSACAVKTNGVMPECCICLEALLKDAHFAFGFKSIWSQFKKLSRKNHFQFFGDLDLALWPFDAKSGQKTYIMCPNMACEFRIISFKSGDMTVKRKLAKSPISHNGEKLTRDLTSQVHRRSTNLVPFESLYASSYMTFHSSKSLSPRIFELQAFENLTLTPPSFDPLSLARVMTSHPDDAYDRKRNSFMHTLAFVWGWSDSYCGSYRDFAFLTFCDVMTSIFDVRRRKKCGAFVQRRPIVRKNFGMIASKLWALEC